MLEPLLPSHCSSEHSCTLLFVAVCRSNSLGWVVVVGVVVVGVVVVGVVVVGVVVVGVVVVGVVVVVVVGQCVDTIG